MKAVLKDSFVLFAITLVAGILLGFVYDITADPIATQKALAKQKACQEVFSEASSIETAKDIDCNALGFDKGRTNEVLEARDNSGNVLGYVIDVTTSEGYGGDITFLVGIKNDGTVNGISFTAINETAGLGMKAKEDKFKGQFANKLVDLFVYTKTGKSADNEIDAISAATITTNAVTNGVNGALAAFRTIMAGGAK